MGYQSFTLRNLRKIPQLEDFDESELSAMEVVAQVLPFKTNSYVIDELINWDRVPFDPIFRLTFPQREMLLPYHFEKMESALVQGEREMIRATTREIRQDLNPHPADQKRNVPRLDQQKLQGIQHKYNETVLFFPSQGQTCHAYCSFCFRWPQFTSTTEKFSSSQIDYLVEYLGEQPQITDVLVTGGDPMVMNTKLLRRYLTPLLNTEIHTIRIGSKSLSYWPYRYDDEALIDLFAEITESKNLSFMAHFNHYQELQTPIVNKATHRILGTGTQIRTQSPVLRHINDDPIVWSRMWRQQVDMGMIPYYMFVVRDTGAQHYFSITLDEAWQIFKDAYSSVSGVCRTVRGPSMSTSPGKIEILGPVYIDGEKLFNMRFIQGRDPDWVGRPFFARYDPNAIWLDDLEPIDGRSFFFEENEIDSVILHEQPHEMDIAD